MNDLYFGHMFGWGFNGTIMMILFWALIIFLIVWAVRGFSQEKPRDQEHTALDVLKDRYAKAEIDKEEFETKKKDLTS